MIIPLRRRRERGVSLVEIPVALVVVALVIICAVRTFKTAGSAQRTSHFGNQATAYGMAKLEEFQGFPSGQMMEGADKVVTPAGMAYERSWKVSDHTAGREVVMTVSWHAAGRDESVKLGKLYR